jgi:hypothetical protein
MVSPNFVKRAVRRTAALRDKIMRHREAATSDQAQIELHILLIAHCAAGLIACQHLKVMTAHATASHQQF